MKVDTAEQLRLTAERLRALWNLKAEMDPASGLSIMIRRGVLSDKVEDRDKRARRQYIELETSKNMEGLLDILIKGLIDDLRYWIGACREERTELAKAMEQAVALLPDKES